LPDHQRQSPAIQFTIRTLMISVAIAALVFYLGRFFGDRLFFGLLPVISALMARGYRSLKPPGHRFTRWEAILVGLSCLAALSPVVALRLAWMMGPAATTVEHFQGFFILAAAGVSPLAIFLFSTWLVRLAGTSSLITPIDLTDSTFDPPESSDQPTQGS
jgi:hypothetical protein